MSTLITSSHPTFLILMIQYVEMNEVEKRLTTDLEKFTIQRVTLRIRYGDFPVILKTFLLII